MRRSLAIMLHRLPRSMPAAAPVPLRALVSTQPLSRNFGSKQSGLDGITVTRTAAAVKQAVAQQRWVVGDADSFKKCDPCEQGGKPLDRSSALALLQQTPDWALAEDGCSISRVWQAKVLPFPDASPSRVHFNGFALTFHAFFRTSRAVPLFCSGLQFWLKMRGTTRTCILFPSTL